MWALSVDRAREYIYEHTGTHKHTHIHLYLCLCVESMSSHLYWSEFWYNTIEIILVFLLSIFVISPSVRNLAPFLKILNIFTHFISPLKCNQTSILATFPTHIYPSHPISALTLLPWTSSPCRCNVFLSLLGLWQPTVGQYLWSPPQFIQPLTPHGRPILYMDALLSLGSDTTPWGSPSCSAIPNTSIKTKVFIEGWEEEGEPKSTFYLEKAF